MKFRKTAYTQIRKDGKMDSQHIDDFLSSIVSVDTETTGKDANVAEVIEIGIAFLTNRWLTYGHLFKPETQELTPECSAVTNISKKMVQNSPTFSEYIDSDKCHVTLTMNDSQIMLAHNAQYDLMVLRRYGVKFSNSLCTLKIAKKLFKDDQSVTAFNLPYLRYRFEILDPADSDLNAHRAPDDALVTAHLLEYFLAIMIERGIVDPNRPIFDQINDWINEPVILTSMPFGKYKGMPFKDVPVSYWKWALDNIEALDSESEKYDADLATSVLAYLNDVL